MRLITKPIVVVFRCALSLSLASCFLSPSLFSLTLSLCRWVARRPCGPSKCLAAAVDLGVPIEALRRACSLAGRLLFTPLSLSAPPCDRPDGADCRSHADMSVCRRGAPHLHLTLHQSGIHQVRTPAPPARMAPASECSAPRPKPASLRILTCWPLVLAPPASRLARKAALRAF